MTVFGVLAPIMVIAALGILFARKAVHAALCLAVVMLSLAMLYAHLQAPFLFAVQIIVYTGAIMMLFLFVLMLVGVDASDSLTETIKGQRAITAGVAVVFGATAVLVIAQSATASMTGLDVANEGGNVEGLAGLLFHRYVIAFEFTAALMITAVLGAMVLAHRERLIPRRSQKELAEQRMRDYAESGRHPGNAPTPGVYASGNAVDQPARLPDGSVSQSSLAPSLANPEATDSLAEELPGTDDRRDDS